MIWILDTAHSLNFFIQIQWGSEMRTSLNFKWSKRVWVATGPDFERDLKSGSATIWNMDKWATFLSKTIWNPDKMSIFWQFRFLNSWELKLKHDHLKSFFQKVWISSFWILNCLISDHMDLKSNHLKPGHKQNQDFLKVGFQIPNHVL